MCRKSYIVRVPAELWIEVSAGRELDAHWNAVQAYEWMLTALRAALSLSEEDDTSFPVSPCEFAGYRVVADFDRASEVRGTLDLDVDDPACN